MFDKNLLYKILRKSTLISFLNLVSDSVYTNQKLGSGLNVLIGFVIPLFLPVKLLIIS